MSPEKSVLVISCGIFKKEINALIAQGVFDFSFMFLDSLLHMDPSKLQSVLSKAIDQALEKGNKVLLIYGDCHPYRDGVYDPKKVLRIKGLNCVEEILGKETYRLLRSEGAFFVFNEWAVRWRAVFVDAIGLTEKTAPQFMGSFHKSINCDLELFYRDHFGGL